MLTVLKSNTINRDFAIASYKAAVKQHRYLCSFFLQWFNTENTQRQQLPRLGLSAVDYSPASNSPLMEYLQQRAEYHSVQALQLETELEAMEKQFAPASNSPMMEYLRQRANYHSTQALQMETELEAMQKQFAALPVDEN